MSVSTMPGQTLSANSAGRAEIAAIMRAILAAPLSDRRSTQRVPFFAPVASAPADSPGVSLFTFSEDLSLSGIGLVHEMPLAAGIAEISLAFPSGRVVDLRTEIKWCRHHGDGWYTSGGRFVDA
ncbi:MAG: PilZ domain-containing protein [Pirellulaceae bacterium]|nr:PilZ domain-containing protein [Pirellulaceae bacterium]